MRLIDADALNKKLCEITIFIKDGAVFQRMINDAPTIEPDGDTISRQAVLDALEESGYCYHFWIDIENIINSLPSAPNKNQHVQYVGCVDLISRQGAINAIENTDCELTTKDWDELTGALKSLPSAPDSRQRETNKEIAERIIDNTCKNRVFCELYPDACQKEKCDIYLVINTFLNTPDIDTQIRQRGEWLWDSGDGEYFCSECRTAQGNSTTEIISGEWKFCPNCGADMRGEEE